MSRQNRRRPVANQPLPPPAATGRRGVATAERPPAAPRPVAGAPGAAGGERHISWRACLIGWVAGEAILLVLTNGALDVTNAAFGGDRVDQGVVGVTSFLAVLCGGLIAARIAGAWGVYQGTVVAIGFIVVYACFQFAQEASIVHAAISSGSHSLVDLGPMSIPNVIQGDLLALFGGSVGGWLARRN